MKASLSRATAFRSREEASAQLRKQRHDENHDTKIPGSEPRDLPDIEGPVAGVNDPNPGVQLEATMQLSRVLSIEPSPPIRQVIEAGVVPKLVEFLQRDSEPQLQTVIRHEAIPKLLHLLSHVSSPNLEVREQAVMALGAISGNSPICRDLVLEAGVMEPLLQQLVEVSPTTVLRNATWTLSNLCYGQPPPDFAVVSEGIPTLARLIHSSDEEVLSHVCWALSYLSDGENHCIRTVIEANVIPRLVELLMHNSVSVQIPALRTLGNITTGDETQIQAVIDASALPCLLTLLQHPRTTHSIRKDVCRTVSNITAGNFDQVMAVIQTNLFPLIIHLLSNPKDDIRKEAARALSNATSGGSVEQIACLVSLGCVGPLCGLLRSQDPRLLNVALEGLENILKAGEEIKGKKRNPYAGYVQTVSGMDKIEALQGHVDEEVNERAVRIVELCTNSAVADEEQEATSGFSMMKFL